MSIWKEKYKEWENVQYIPISPEEAWKAALRAAFFELSRRGSSFSNLFADSYTVTQERQK